MFRRPIKEINAEFKAEEKYLDSIQRTARESCVAASMSKKEIAAVLLAIEEGATNIIRHAYLYEKGLMRVRIVIYKKMVVFSLIDYGRSFQPDKSGKVNLQKLVESGRKGGLGFYMIQKIMDSVEYISTASFNELRMIKRINEDKQKGRPFLRRMFSLRFKFSFWTFIIVSMIIGGSIYYFDHEISAGMYRHKQETVQALGTTIAAQTAGYLINNRSDVEFDELVVSYKLANPELRLIVLTDDNQMIRAHSDNIINIRKKYKVPKGIIADKYNTPQPYFVNNEKVEYLIVPVELGRNIIGKVHIIYTTESIYYQLAKARKQIIILTVFLLLFGVIGIYLLSNYFVSPILKITHRIRRFTSGDLETELPLEGAEEFFEISKAFNQMITRLSQDRKNIAAREKMAKEIEVASQIQKTLLPHKLPMIPHLEVETFYRAASMIGGDLYDVFKVTDSKYCMVVADVSGKGVPASLVMSMLRTVIQIYVKQILSPKNIIVSVNDYLKKNIPPGMFVTAFLLMYDSTDNSIQYVSAGHNPMLYFNNSLKKIEELNPKGMPVGLPTKDKDKFENIIIEEKRIMQDNDCFIVFTDGITEAPNRDGNLFGMERLKDLILTNVSGTSISMAELSDIIIDAVDDYTGFNKAVDDISFIVAKSMQKALGTSLNDSKEKNSSLDIKSILVDSSDSENL